MFNKNIIRPLSHWKIISKFMLICSFRKKISSVNSQLLKEINFEILFCNLEYFFFILRNFAEENSLMECSDWSVGVGLQTSNEASTASSMLAFESSFPM